ncbi:ATP-binding protein [Paracoccus sediminis]|uniref:AAA+-type ATPase, SpoVK/Ycf46/Vps4 family n=1 Tax=Paracoccus sediminis TaxID=1214787 RepID=A0A238WX09_9RHOB|nr:ATP-binding protein [Paracoccus sediminis]TBN50099.1 ATP-binding protein [Paracoccus sediminis]SNR51077.1 AAA+-type ATPase, SpoVK/Ycf46/Vps4 family [Paracoccus sediminis]
MLRAPPLFAATRPAPPPDPVAAASAALSELNGWLAARILSSGRTTLPPERAAAVERAAGAQARMRASGRPHLPGLDRVSAAMGLDDAERDLLLAAALVEASPEAARLIAVMGEPGASRRMVLGQVAALGFEPADFLVRLRPDAPMVDFGLVALKGDGPLVTRELAVPPDVTAAVLGLRGASALPLRLMNDEDRSRPLPPGIADRVAALTRMLTLREMPGAPFIIVTGTADSGRRDIARRIAASLRPTAVEAPLADLAEPERQAAFRRTVRMNDAVAILGDPQTAELEMLRAILRGLDSPVIVIAPAGSFAPIAARVDRVAVSLDVPRSDVSERAELWRQAIPSVDAEDRTRIAQRFAFGRAGIGRALRLAVTSARIEGRRIPTGDDLLAACDQIRTAEFDGSAQRMTCTFRREDIVLRRETEAELDLAIAWARHGSRLFAQDGPGGALGAGHGLACLFSGPPGTGKTMAAQIVARQVDYALYRIDLSRVIDKFIGESEKRLAALFDEAERSRVALFFDEADACFGKRTELRDSHDRYANITIDFLLQRLESFEGLAILATNLVGNMDDAFLRRIRVRAEFTPPGPPERKRIWDRLLPLPGSRSDDIDIAILSDAFELVGGEIRNAIYTAHLLAAGEREVLAMRHCVKGLWRELAKIGRLPDRTRLGVWQHLVADETGRSRLAGR